ncbi:GNAT family N-acetyltransferase [Jeotgalibacillus terrae]|uniref:GNAT family N-acetyltransferase n=1 Tax=Jeotgalibacillus terrae TaxID=587735 RepID=A0ABW5ZLY1_9BACL|nr:GNAT family N-acetyltransferase [Jeotgalibacillus terrae]MBM7581109.1 ribosomal protein S18 acetylase RimI-like enzyme [Jeotgalibacillus terrae]
MRLERVLDKKRIDYIDWLLLADDSKEAVLTYIESGDLFLIYIEEEMSGVMLMTPVSEEQIELKNIALAENRRGKGTGRAVIEKVIVLYKEKGFKSMIVGTANSSIENLAFYQKAGFRMVSIKKDFFAGYEPPIYEHGIRALDMVVFERKL